MMLTVKDEWVRAAMTDDSVVVELLVRLKQAQAQAAMPVSKSAAAVAALRWGIRQPRSRSSATRCDGAVSQKGGKGGDSGTSSGMMRASPTTPLSWSGGGGGAVSPSATADAFEETSRHQTSSGARSKGIATNETTSNATKRSRRKKTFAELKEEEDLLLKESCHLKKEIETLRASYKEHSAANVNLKRMKLDLGLHSAKNTSETFSDETQKTISDQVHKDVVESIPSSLPSLSTVSSEAHKAASTRNIPCLLPDLNMMPSEDDSSSETLYDKRTELTQLELRSPKENSLEGKGKLRSVMKKKKKGYEGSLEIVTGRSCRSRDT
ncbi:hypothetical protein Q3G72_008702 [Acer saccharum]|nr:hypothetical protein Q3G72_008702 [Acer saccharum]